MTEENTLYLLPNLLGNEPHHHLFIPASVDAAVAKLDGLIAESTTGGRRYLSRFQTKKPPFTIPIALLNRDTPTKDIDFLLDPIQKGESWGYVSDCGLPCIADPGAQLVRRAYERKLSVETFSGPSSVFLSLILSGFSNQKFFFHGYLEREIEKLKSSLIQLEKGSKSEKATQLFIETPHRTQTVLETALQILKSDTYFCVAWDLTLATQGVLSLPIEQWKKRPLPDLHKRTAIFLLNSINNNNNTQI